MFYVYTVNLGRVAIIIHVTHYMLYVSLLYIYLIHCIFVWYVFIVCALHLSRKGVLHIRDDIT